MKYSMYYTYYISCSNVQYTWLSAANSKNSRILIGNSDTSPYRVLIVLINNLVNNLQRFAICSLVKANNHIYENT